MKVKCILQHKQLEGILDKGDIVEIETVEIETVRSTEDQIIVHNNMSNKNPFILKITEDTIRPAGSYIDYHFKSKNGEYYSGKCIEGFIGPKPIDELFKKL
jgi:hypothetical protein